MSMPKTKVALVGTGWWGWQHARVLSSHRDVDFCAIAGRDPEKTRKRAEEFHVRPYTNLQQMIATEKPELVCVCLPNQQHFEPTLELVRAGVPLFVEKPLVFDLKEADTLMSEVGKRNLFFTINFNHRFAKPVQLAKQAIDAGKLGEIVFATWRFGGEGSSDHPHANLIETQCHGFDLLEYLCGPIESVMAEMTDKTGGGFRTIALSLKFESGAVGSLVGTYDSSYAYPGTHFMEINGTRGRVTIEDTVRRFTFQQVGNETAEVWQSSYFNDFDREFLRTFDKHFDAVITAFRAFNLPPVDAKAGRRALRLAHAAIESFETGTRIRVG